MCIRDSVRSVGDAVAIVVGESEKAVDKALNMIKVKYTVLEPVLDFRKSLDNKVLVHPEDDWSSSIDTVSYTHLLSDSSLKGRQHHIR